MQIRFIKVSVFVLLLLALLGYTGFLIEKPEDNSEGHHDHSDHYHEHSHNEGGHVSERLIFPSSDPDRVILNVTETPETSFAVNWRTDTTVLAGTVEWAVATAGPDFLQAVTKIPAQLEKLKVKRLEEPVVSANYFSARVNNLKPGGKYVYRVGY